MSYLPKVECAACGRHVCVRSAHSDELRPWNHKKDGQPCDGAQMNGRRLDVPATESELEPPRLPELERPLRLVDDEGRVLPRPELPDDIERWYRAVAEDLGIDLECCGARDEALLVSLHHAACARLAAARAWEEVRRERVTQKGRGGLEEEPAVAESARKYTVTYSRLMRELRIDAA